MNHLKDPGGATNLGITRATLQAWRGKPVTKADVRALTREEAAAIYRANYWNKVKGDDLPAGLDLVAFDAAVNSGTCRAAKWLQSAVGAAPDGLIGPKTIELAKKPNSALAARRALQARKNFLLSLPTWSTFGKGWSARLNSVEAAALKMAKGN